MALRILPLVLALFAQPWLACAAGPTEAAPARQASEEAPQGASEEATKEEAEHAAQSGEAQDGASVSVDEEAAHEAAAQEVAKLPLLAQGRTGCRTCRQPCGSFSDPSWCYSIRVGNQGCRQSNSIRQRCPDVCGCCYAPPIETPQWCY
mmetsp:Transcript_113044/g.315896  ORF Transcript_113044/g.315896 Transcript_113044/m.315896 type:complete len:149 (+) Transcript_113044:63-509(+)